MFWKSILSKFSFMKLRHRVGKPRRLGLEVLEDRLAPASISQNGTSITVTLNNTNEIFHIHASSANHYALSATNFTGSVNAPSSFSGFGADSGTLVTSGITQINVVATAVAGASVTFDDSAADYAEFIRVSLTNAGSGTIQFNGTSTFDAGLAVLQVNNSITVNAGATINLHGFNSSLQANGATATVNLNGNLIADSTSLLVIAGQNISQGVGGVIKTAPTTSVSFNLNAAQGDIVLGIGINDLAGSVSFGQAAPGSVRDVSLRNTNPTAQLPSTNNLTIRNLTLIFDNTEIVLPAGLNVTGDLNVSAGSGIRQSGAINVGGNGAFAILSNGNIVLDTVVGNTIGGSVSFDTTKCDNTTSVGYLETGAVILGSSNLGLGQFTISANGNITQTGAITQKRGGADVSFNLASGGNTVTLNNAANAIEGFLGFFGFATTVSLTNTSTLAAFPDISSAVTSLTLNFPRAPAVLPDVNLNNLAVTAEGIYQAAGTSIHVSGNVDLNAKNNPLVLNNAGNDFNLVRLRNSGPNRVIILDANSINFAVADTVLGSGPLAVTAGGGINQGAATITQAAFAARATFTAGIGFAINLNQTNGFHGPLIFNTSGANGNVTLSNSGPTILGASNIGGDLTFTNSSVNEAPLSQDPGSTLTVGGNTVISTSGLGSTATATINLDNLGNNFLGSVSITGVVVCIRDSGPLDFSVSDIRTSLKVHAGGAITQSAVMIGGSVALFDAGTAAITLTNPNNDFAAVSAISTGAEPVAIRDANSLQIDQLKLGSGALTITCSRLEQNAEFGVTQTAATPVTFDVSSTLSLTSAKNNILGPLALPRGGTFLSFTNQGDIRFVGTPVLTGVLQLFSGGVLTLPDVALNLLQIDFRANRTIVKQNVTAVNGISFLGRVDFEGSATTLDCPFIRLDGDVNPAGALSFNLGANGDLTLATGKWSQGANSLTINGGGVFNVGSTAQFGRLATFNMLNGTINMPGGANIVVNDSATFKVGGNALPETVVVDNNAGAITFKAGSTLSVGLGATNDKLVKAAGDTGNIIIEQGAKLSSYAGLAGALPSLVLDAAAGVLDTNRGFFDQSVDFFSHAPRDFLMGTDIVRPNYSETQLTIVTGGTVVSAGIASGFEFDGDKFTLSAVKTGTTTGVPFVFDQNNRGGIEIVIRNAAVPTTLTVTSTKNLGDGFNQVGGIAVNGPGSVVINAPLSNVFGGDILIAGALSALTVRSFSGIQTRSALLRAGGTSSSATTITGRTFGDLVIDLPTVLTSWTLNGLFSSGAKNVVNAERFGTIKCTSNLAENLRGDFEVDRLINLNRANSALPAIGSVTISGTLGNNSGTGAMHVWDIAGNIGSVTAAGTHNWQLGTARGANVRNGDQLHNVGALNLGSVRTSNLHATGKVSSLVATNWLGGDLQAGVFGTIKIAGNGTSGIFNSLGNFNDITLTATGNSGRSTVTGIPSFEALASLSVTGDTSHVTVRLVDGNATSIVAARVASHWDVTAEVTANGGGIAKLVAGKWDELVLDAKNAGTVAAVGNVPGNVFGDFNGEIVLHGKPGFTGVALGALKVNRDMQDSNVLAENGSIGTIAVGHSMTNVNLRALGAAGAITAITAGEWISPGNSTNNLVARNIGSLTITGAPGAAPGGFLAGDFRRVNVLAFLNGGTNPAIGALSVAGNYFFTSDFRGFLRADNGINTFKVGRSLGDGVSNGQNAFNGNITLLNSSAVSDVPGRIGSLTVGQWLGINVAAKTLGAVKALGFATPESPQGGFHSGAIIAGNIALSGATNSPLTPHVSLDSLTANSFGLNLLAPFGITSMVIANDISGATINTDNPPAGTAGRIGTLQAAFFENTQVRAASIGTLKAVSAIGNSGEFTNSDITVTGFTGLATAPVAIGTISISGNMRQSTVNVPFSITNFAVGRDAVVSEIAAGFAANSGIAMLSVGRFGSTLTARSIGTFSARNGIVNSLITLTGNNAGVALGNFITPSRVNSSTFNITGGNVRSFIVGEFSSSRLLIGFHMPSPGDIGDLTDASNWLSGSTFTLGIFKTTGLFDPTNVPFTASFRDSYVVAQRLGTITLAGLDPDVSKFGTSFRFGIAFRASRGSGPIIKVNGLNKIVGFAVGEFIYEGLEE